MNRCIFVKFIDFINSLKYFYRFRRRRFYGNPDPCPRSCGWLSCRSFSRAAAQLGYSQAAVTIQIRQLEEELGVQLFERIGKKVRLTEEGTASDSQSHRRDERRAGGAGSGEGG